MTQDPFLVIDRFFSDYGLPECHQILWDMVETCLTSDNVLYQQPGQRADLLLRHRHFEELLDAAYALLQEHRMPQDGQK